LKYKERTRARVEDSHDSINSLRGRGMERLSKRNIRVKEINVYAERLKYKTRHTFIGIPL